MYNNAAVYLRHLPAGECDCARIDRNLGGIVRSRARFYPAIGRTSSVNLCAFIRPPAASSAARETGQFLRERAVVCVEMIMTN